MTGEQKALVQTTFQAVVPIADVAAALFYQRLFEIDPSTRPLFKGDMQEQGQKLMATLGVLIQGFDELNELAPMLEAMGRRHRGYGVTDSHYASVGAALLWTLEQGLGPAFTPQVNTAWAESYTLIATIMKIGALASA